MSEEQFARIEAKLDTLVASHHELRAEVADLHDGQATLRTGQEELRGEVVGLRAGQDELRAGQEELRAGQIVLHNRFDRLERKTEMEFEQLHDKVDLIAEGHGALEIKMDKGFAELREEIGRRLDPLERVVRDLAK